MNNVAYLGTRNNQFAPVNLSAEDPYFPVSLQEFDVHYGGANFASADDFRAVVREDTGQVLAVHSNKYNLIGNDEIFPEFEEQMRKSSLDLTDMYTTTNVIDGGGAVIKSYHLPAHNVEARVGDITEMVIRLRNSYNSRWATVYDLIGNRLVCTNGMVTSSSFVRAYGRHTKNFNVQNFVEKLSVSAEKFLEHADIWKVWAGKKIHGSQVTELVESLKLPEKYKEELMLGFNRECQEAGRTTIWELFNAMTWLSTHGDVRKGTQAVVAQESREKRVQQIINSQAFARLAA